MLVEQFTVEQNLALPLSITVEDMTPEIRARVADLAREIGLANELQRQAGVLGPALRARIRLGRALALGGRRGAGGVSRSRVHNPWFLFSRG